MRSEELTSHAEWFTSAMKATCKKKNADYTGGASDALANFKVVENYHIPATQGLLTRMSDKMMRIGTFCSGQELQVSDEGVQDTLMDLANYAMLLSALIRDSERTMVDHARSYDVEEDLRKAQAVMGSAGVKAKTVARKKPKA